MINVTVMHLSFSELCQATSIPTETIIEIVNEGIIEPKGSTPKNWEFDVQMVAKTKKAMRLHKDLEIDWPGIAFALSLIDELEQLRRKNETLQRRLDRFTHN